MGTDWIGWAAGIILLLLGSDAVGFYYLAKISRRLRAVLTKAEQAEAVATTAQQVARTVSETVQATDSSIAALTGRVTRVEEVLRQIQPELHAIRTSLDRLARRDEIRAWLEEDRAARAALLDDFEARLAAAARNGPKPPKQRTSVTVAGGKRSAAVGGPARRSPIVSGDENELEQGD